MLEFNRAVSKRNSLVQCPHCSTPHNIRSIQYGNMQKETVVTDYFRCTRCGTEATVQLTFAVKGRIFTNNNGALEEAVGRDEFKDLF